MLSKLCCNGSWNKNILPKVHTRICAGLEKESLCFGGKHFTNQEKWNKPQVNSSQRPVVLVQDSR